jgi:hypothetical protein
MIKNNNMKKEEILNKWLYKHGGPGLGITNGDVYRAVLDAMDEFAQLKQEEPREEENRECIECGDKYDEEEIKHGICDYCAVGLV